MHMISLTSQRRNINERDKVYQRFIIGSTDTLGSRGGWTPRNGDRGAGGNSRLQRIACSRKVQSLVPRSPVPLLGAGPGGVYNTCWFPPPAGADTVTAAEGK